jgi:Rrf2 family nitric oxide-sensitive transcriptional repressor
MLTQTGIYALRARGFMAAQPEGKPVLSAVIAEQVDIPRNFVSKILHRLVQGGLVHSIRGKQGGFVLALPATSIKVRDVVDLFVKIDDFHQCFLGMNACDGTCGLHDAWRTIIGKYEEMLNLRTIDQILPDACRPEDPEAQKENAVN